jgi:hypothetical protein
VIAEPQLRLCAVHRSQDIIVINERSYIDASKACGPQNVYDETLAQL